MVRDWQKISAWHVVLGVAITFFVLVLGFSLHRYNVFYADSDHGIFSQVFWNGTQGRIFQSSVSSTYSVSVFQDGDVPEVFYHRLAQHFTPALLLWLPLYAAFPSPITLIVLKVALITAGGLVLYALARHYLSPRIAAWIAISFYTANTVIGPALGEFYDFSQLPLFGFGMLLALEKRWWWLFGILGTLILLVRQDAGLAVFGIGIYLILSKRFPRIGMATCAISFLYMLIVTTQIMPLFTDEVSRRFMVEEFGHFTEEQQASTTDVIGAIARRPWLLLQELVTPVDRVLKYLLGHGLPLAFIPALSPPAWMISGLPLLENLLRREDGPLSINIRYTTPVVPGLFYGAILWWSTRQDRFKSLLFRRFWALCISLSLFFTLTSNPGRAWSFLIPDSFDPWVYTPITQQWHHAAAARSLLQQIPSDASVSASRNLVAHLANRRALLRFPGLRFRDDDQKAKSVDYVVVDLGRSLTYQTAFENSRNELRDEVQACDRMLRRRWYGVIGFQDGVVLLQRKVEHRPEAFAAWSAFRQAIAPLLQS